MTKSELKIAKSRAENSESVMHFYGGEFNGGYTISIEFDDGYFETFDNLETVTEALHQQERW